MTPQQAITNAIESASPENALAWVAVAAELRAQDAGPALASLLGQVKNQLPAEDPAERLTLHDISAKTCSHLRIALRRKNTSGWWLHADDGTNCVG